ncbi:gamma-taxilin [Austrofundulus limnaeus]|uniref:Gamma-taxilin n=1 Tax=Austrofundulus limnaeus TaxID=52670 RepID=A0A2I4C070_AUSLI|nr:PREDICTED: beta-taxilin [Austrofundulus limnaeus]
MEASVEAAELMVPPKPDEAPSLEDEAKACSSPFDTFDPMQEFSHRLEDIIRTHGSADSLLDKLRAAEIQMDEMKEEVKDESFVMETDVSLVRQSLSIISSPEEKLEELIRKYCELAALRLRGEQKTNFLQQTVSVLQEERQQLQAERLSSTAARSKLEALCRDLQGHYNLLREETLLRCREDEEKRKEITSHFQDTLTEIQAQIELHSARNDNLCRENANLNDKLENLMTQYERREESLEKINKHRDLQHKLTEAKLQQANALLSEAEDKHKREKEYLLREAIDKTKKCFAMKEQELAMKKKLTLYGQKFDEFQATLAKSNEIYVRFRKEMDNMTEKMKKVEKESNLWKTRFENCNKALTDMIEERTEKGQEYDLFVLKIQKLEKLCRALQEERKGLYQKIKEVCQSNANLPKVFFNLVADEAPVPEDHQEQEEEDPVLTENIARLRDEQAKLQEIAASLLGSPDPEEEEDLDLDQNLEEDEVVSAFVRFKSKTQTSEGPEDLKPPMSKDKDQSPKAEGPSSEAIKMKTDPETSGVQTQVHVREQKPDKAEEEIQKPAEPTPEPETPKTGPEPEASKVQETSEVQPTLPVEDKMSQQTVGPNPEPQTPNPEPTNSETLEETGGVRAVPPAEAGDQEPEEPSPASEKAAESSVKQAPKKKKKRSSRS